MVAQDEAGTRAVGVEKSVMKRNDGQVCVGWGGVWCGQEGIHRNGSFC